MLKTKNYKLNKPEKNDTVNITKLNENSDIIDNKIKEIENKIKNVEVPVKSVNGKTGEVKLTANDVNAYDKTETDNKFATKDELGNIDVPVTKVNGKTGDVTLSATDIKAKDGKTLEQFKTETTSQLAENTKQINTKMDRKIKDDTTNKKYELGIKNGLLYYREVQ